MKIIFLRQGGSHRFVNLSRRGLGAVCVVMGTLFFAGAGWLAAHWQVDNVDAEVVAQWRNRLAEQQQVVVQLEHKSQAQSAAVGRQLAEMQARLLRMEAIGAHMADAAELPEGEFDFSETPAQGGPVHGEQDTLDWSALQAELSSLAGQLKRRETELTILDSVLVNEDIQQSSQVRGRPVTWGWVSSQYGKRVDPLTGKTAWHSGVDFAGHDGSDVIAVASGVVTFAGARSGYGKMVEISHANGLVTRYAHHKELLVTTGEIVKKGEAVGIMGSTGRSTGPHVHFEVLKNGRTVDPTQYVARRS